MSNLFECMKCGHPNDGNIICKECGSKEFFLINTEKELGKMAGAFRIFIDIISIIRQKRFPSSVLIDRHLQTLPIRVLKVDAQKGEVLVIGRECKVTGELYSFEITGAILAKVSSSYAIQQVAELTDDQREFIMNNITPAEFDQLYGEED